MTYPMMNFILPLRAVSTRIGTSCGSRGPKMPWGRMATVRKPFSLSQASRTSWNTKDSGQHSTLHTAKPYDHLLSSLSWAWLIVKGVEQIDLQITEEVLERCTHYCWRWYYVVDVYKIFKKKCILISSLGRRKFQKLLNHRFIQITFKSGGAGTCASKFSISQALTQS